MRAYHLDMISWLAIPADCHGSLLCWGSCIPYLSRETNWLAHLVLPRTRSRHDIQIDVHLLTTVPGIRCPRRTQYRWQPIFHLQRIPRIPYGVLGTDYPQSHIPNLMAKQSSRWKLQRIVNGNTGPQVFLDDDNVAQGHLAVLKHPNPKYWPLTSATPTPLPILWFHSFTSHTLNGLQQCNVTPLAPTYVTFSFSNLFTSWPAGDQLVVPRGVTHISCHYKNTIEGVGEKESKRTNTNKTLGVNQEQKELCNTTFPIAYMD